jgi:hypothetical protein
MIIGKCPYCDGDLWIAIAEYCPVFERHICEHCGKVIWTYHSRVDPVSYTEDEFAAKYTHNTETREITAREEDTPA